jgi:hypothetical protein
VVNGFIVISAEGAVIISVGQRPTDGIISVLFSPEGATSFLILPFQGVFRFLSSFRRALPYAIDFAPSGHSLSTFNS